MEAVFNISLPTTWAELTDEQLLMVYHLFASDLSAAEVKTLCLMKWNHLKVLATLPRHRFLIKRGKEQVVLNTRQIQQATSVLDFLDSFAPMPIRITRIGKYRALPADFEKVPFEQYLENTSDRSPSRPDSRIVRRVICTFYVSEFAKNMNMEIKSL